jgi:hypothetical protein
MTYAAASSYDAAYQTVVPVDVYQEAVADLQEAQSMIRSLEAQNREMWKENQQLQQEISRFLGSVNQFQRGSDGSVTVPAQRVISVDPNQLADITDQEEIDSSDMNIWNIIITVLCIIAVGASVGYSAIRPPK